MPVEFPLVIGWEDVRLFETSGGLACSATVRQISKEGWCDQCYGQINDKWEISDWWHMKPNLPNGERRYEKNWMPWVKSGDAKFVYRLGEIVDRHGGFWFPENHKPLSYDVGALSGGTQVVPFGPYSYLALVHEARYRPGDGQRYYQHRFVEFDGDGTVTAISRPFVFHDRQIEFAAGLARRDDEYVISYGVRDREAWLGTIKWHEIAELFNG